MAARRNEEVGRLFENIADLLEIKGDQAYRINAYRNAARSIASHREDVEDLYLEGRLREIRGVGEAIEKKIIEYMGTGKLEFYERLKAEFPPGLVALLEVPGLGPRRARLIYQELGITTLAQLEEAARSQRLRGLAGLGEKTELTLLQELEALKARTRRHLLSSALATAEQVLRYLQTASPVDQVAWAGSLRRMKETIGNLDLVAASRSPERVLEAFVAAPWVVEVAGRGRNGARVVLADGLLARLHVVSPEAWGPALLFHTGSREHVARLQSLAVDRGWELGPDGLVDSSNGHLLHLSEQEVYERLGLQYVPPELREDWGEVEAALAGQVPELVSLDHIRGDLHMHSTWSDGASSLEEMAQAAMARGYEYMAITDHTRSLGVARGLDEERLREQRRLVDRLNERLHPFRILLGTEMDIRRDGTLDLADDVLGEIDFVSVSVHSGFSQPQEVMTERVLRAISNPHVAVFNHPRGRLLRRREPYRIDMDAVLAAAARHGVALEVNSQPERLDLDGFWARRAIMQGAKIVINSDAHHSSHLDILSLGVATARRGWACPSDVLNTMPLVDLMAYLAGRRAQDRRPA